MRFDTTTPVPEQPKTNLPGDDKYTERSGSVIYSGYYGTVEHLPKPFTWGHVVTTHVVGPYAIVESIRGQYGNETDEEYDLLTTEELTGFHPFIYLTNGKVWDTGHTCGSLDRALVKAVTMRAYKERGENSEAVNERASGLFMKMIGPGDDADE